MQIKTKKIIAREFLIVLLVIAIGGVPIGFHSLKNQWKGYAFEKKQDSLNTQILLKRDSLSLISNSATQLYNFLKENDLTDLEEAVFIIKYSNPIESEKIWAYFKDNGLTEKDFNSFYRKYFHTNNSTEYTIKEIPEKSDQRDLLSSIKLEKTKKYTIHQFAEIIKSKYPEYKDINDTLLVNKIIEKYPTYKNQIKKKPFDVLPSPPPKGLFQSTEIPQALLDSLNQEINSRDKLQNEISSLQGKLNNDHVFWHLISQEEIFKSGIYAAIAAFIALFFIRYLFYAIRWSIKTLKSPPIEKP